MFPVRTSVFPTQGLCFWSSPPEKTGIERVLYQIQPKRQVEQLAHSSHMDHEGAAWNLETKPFLCFSRWLQLLLLQTQQRAMWTSVSALWGKALRQGQSFWSYTPQSSVATRCSVKRGNEDYRTRWGIRNLPLLWCKVKQFRWTTETFLLGFFFWKWSWEVKININFSKVSSSSDLPDSKCHYCLHINKFCLCPWLRIKVSSSETDWDPQCICLLFKFFSPRTPEPRHSGTM